MATPLIQIDATILCSHAGSASITPSQTRVRADGRLLAVVSDSTTVAGCPLTLPNGKPQPCTTIRWVTSATRVRLGGTPALLQSSSGICQSAEQIPQGAPNVVTTQTRVRGT
ncbi:MAG TPA: hypothetical protein PKA05_06995 [Roseiflexaceae bacterium]|nr:hypothetical protein [Roseiflexaceae bacterium]HMP40110.1 hypothetical protein [Roseiflexaceae bacterium]